MIDRLDKMNVSTDENINMTMLLSRIGIEKIDVTECVLGEV